jgi:hypothetical protein
MSEEFFKGRCTRCLRDDVLVATRPDRDGRVLCSGCVVWRTGRCDECKDEGVEVRPVGGIPSPDRPNQLLCATCEPEPEPTRPWGRTLTLTPASEIKSRRVRWMWPGWIPLRSLVVVAGEAGLGKSIFTNAWLVAKITRGELDGELAGQPADALIVSAEDDWETVIKPRLMAHNADLQRVHRITVTDEIGECTLTLPDDVTRLEEAIDRLCRAGRTVALVVVDPISSFLAGSTDSHKEAPVRRALAPLAALAMRRELVVLAVAHLNKDQSQRLLSRLTGAGAFGNAPRSVIGFARDPDDPEGEQGPERVIVHAKTNWGQYATSIAARVESRLVDTDDDERTDVGYLVVTGESSVGVEDLYRRGDDGSGSDYEEAIAAALADGPRPSREVKVVVAAELSCSRKTVQRAAMRMRDRGDLTVEEGGFPRTTTWTLVVEKPVEEPSRASRDTLLLVPDVPTTTLSPPTDESAVGTPPFETQSSAHGVPTATPPMDTGDASSGESSRASRDTVPAREAQDPDSPDLPWNASRAVRASEDSRDNGSNLYADAVPEGLRDRGAA